MVLILLTIGFSAANMNKVQVHYLVGSSEIYVSVVIFVAFFLGGAVGALLRIPAHQKLKRENAKLLKKIKKTAEEQQEAHIDLSLQKLA